MGDSHLPSGSTSTSSSSSPTSDPHSTGTTTKPVLLAIFLVVGLISLILVAVKLAEKKRPRRHADPRLTLSTSLTRLPQPRRAMSAPNPDADDSSTHNGKISKHVGVALLAVLGGLICIGLVLGLVVRKRRQRRFHAHHPLRGGRISTDSAVPWLPSSSSSSRRPPSLLSTSTSSAYPPPAGSPPSSPRRPFAPGETAEDALLPPSSPFLAPEPPSPTYSPGSDELLFSLYRSAVILSPSPSATVESTSTHRDTGWIVALSLAVGVTAVVLLVAAVWWFRYRKRGGESPPPPPPPAGEKVPWLYRVPVLAALSYSTRSLTSFSAPRHHPNPSVTTLSTVATTEENGGGGRGRGGYDQGAAASRRRSESFVTLEMGRPGVSAVDRAAEKK
ncbi:hypothetical protein JCM8097_001010 [Rhodosporidiobolus ruineniae]